jgi:16S rRNA (guanine527-N7)-methyltransferase
MNNNQENQDITNIYIEETLIKRLKQINSELKLDLDLELDINLSDNQIKSFIKYLKLLQKWNKAYNLTAIDKTLDIIEYHFIDCLQIAPYLSKYKNILDVGTGAGFPGIVLAIYNLDQNILLLDKSQKKIQFLKLVCHELGLNIKNNRALCSHERIETNKPINPPRKFDAIISRAVTQIKPFLDLTSHLLEDNGVIYIMKAKLENIKKEQLDLKNNYPNWNIEIYSLANLKKGEHRHLIKLVNNNK